MVNQYKRVVVWYPGIGLRTRNCETTVYPDGYVKRSSVTGQEQTANFNQWAVYIRSQVDPNLDAGEILLAEAKGLLLTSSVKLKK